MLQSHSLSASFLDCRLLARVVAFQNGLAPLHLAAAKGHAPAVELFLRHGARINLQDGVSPAITCELGFLFGTFLVMKSLCVVFD